MHRNLPIYPLARIPLHRHRKPGGKLVSQQPEEAKNNIAVPAVSVMIPTGFSPVCCSRSLPAQKWNLVMCRGQRCRGIRVLIRDEVVPGDATSGTKIFLLGPELTVFTGVTKRMPSAEPLRHHPSGQQAPVWTENQPAGIGADQRFCPEVILFYPAKRWRVSAGILCFISGSSPILQPLPSGPRTG